MPPIDPAKAKVKSTYAHPGTFYSLCADPSGKGAFHRRLWASPTLETTSPCAPGWPVKSSLACSTRSRRCWHGQATWLCSRIHGVVVAALVRWMA